MKRKKGRGRKEEEGIKRNKGRGGIREKIKKMEGRGKVKRTNKEMVKVKEVMKRKEEEKGMKKME
jgi:hypothetical protein